MEELCGGWPEAVGARRVFETMRCGVQFSSALLTKSGRHVFASLVCWPGILMSPMDHGCSAVCWLLLAFAKLKLAMRNCGLSHRR